jgi:hypothetical protein
LRLRDALACATDLSEVESAASEIELLEGIRRRRWQRRSIAWMLMALAIIFLLAPLLHFALHLRSVDVVLVVNTAAMMIGNGATTQNVLPAGITAHEVVMSGSRGDKWSIEDGKARPPSWSVVQSLQIESLFLNTRSTAMVRTSGACIEVEIFKGGGLVNIVTVSSPAGQTHEVRASLQSIDLAPRDRVRFCGYANARLQASDLTSVIIGERIGGGRSETKDIPALTNGTLAVLNTNSSVSFQRTDVPTIAGLSEDSLTARLRDPMEATIVGKATSVRVASGVEERELMPSWLDWLRSNRGVQTALAIAAAVVGAVIAMRKHLLEELM